MDNQIFDINNLQLTINGEVIKLNSNTFIEMPENSIKFIDKELHFTITAKELKRTPDVEITFITGQKILLPGRYIQE
jgi:hypothetical protein